jgi:hypothetical protein
LGIPDYMICVEVNTAVATDCPAPEKCATEFAYESEKARGEREGKGEEQVGERGVPKFNITEHQQISRRLSTKPYGLSRARQSRWSSERSIT